MVNDIYSLRATLGNKVQIDSCHPFNLHNYKPVRYFTVMYDK